MTAVVICPDARAGAEVAGLAQRALPAAQLLSCANAAEAVSQAQRAQVLGPAPAIFAFDFRGLPVGDLVGQVQLVRRAYPEAEVIVVAEGRDSPVFAACLQVTGAPTQLTFLLAPLRPREVVSIVSGVGERHRAVVAKKRSDAEYAAIVQSLRTEGDELRARLAIAMHAARHDSLTGILNRAGFIDELNVRLTRNAQPQTVFLIDLDRFKTVNDTLGHEAGDDLVRKICTALSAFIPAGGLIARLGGDEFGIAVEALSDAGVEAFCAKILHVCSQVRRVLGHEVQVSASVGVAHQGAIIDQVELMRHADLALYAAKREGRNRYRVYDAAIDAAARRRHSIESGLERALNTSQFKMAYQPIVDAKSGAVKGFEALIRWNSPQHGAISPQDFVPIAEETGLILDIGDWIARQALKDCRRWGGRYVSINLSAKQFLRHNVAERILRFAEDATVAPELIQIELTETAIIDDVERADHNLRILRGAGVRVALDDFGTGYSSLVYLNRFAIDCIKIDKSFVDNVTRDRQSAMIIASVSRLAASLGMGVVAEGVETEAQREVLIAAGCGMLQGYRFGRPMAASDVPDFLANPLSAQV